MPYLFLSGLYPQHLAECLAQSRFPQLNSLNFHVVALGLVNPRAIS